MSDTNQARLNYLQTIWAPVPTIAQDIKKVVDMGEALPPDRMVGGLKRAIVKQGMEKEFENLFGELASKVREHDKGCKYYDLYKSEQPRTYLVMEQYENRDALQLHQKSEHGRYYFPKIRELLENIEVTYYECLLPLSEFIE